MKAILRNKDNFVKEVKVGFSWTTFFFGFFPALIRGDLKWAAIIFIVTLSVGFFTVGIGGWVTSLVFAISYNKIYTKNLLKKGYEPADEKSRKLLEDREIISRIAS
ncbi:DUF2628 domain-containing protein [Aciduricibacillus chroicocephali]|uniref:DUF2628 domain-containing protein n=1 Tax=Aciduricibacillus chroicocephali TaxID=3054939 RepID=A0ABY9KUQ2_9BACI|nr:DUF2628 domain-containing protein [Bacillaceae bacterium 44XB]